MVQQTRAEQARSTSQSMLYQLRFCVRAFVLLLGTPWPRALRVHRKTWSCFLESCHLERYAPPHQVKSSPRRQRTRAACGQRPYGVRGITSEMDGPGKTRPQLEGKACTRKRRAGRAETNGRGGAAGYLLLYVSKGTIDIVQACVEVKGS
jgi:hypothetical protein